MKLTTIEEEPKSDKEARKPQRKRKALKSGKVQTANSMVVKKITWPHELVYKAEEKLTMYTELTFPLFVSGYLAVLDT